MFFTGKKTSAVVDSYTVSNSLALHSLPSLHVQKEKSVCYLRACGREGNHCRKSFWWYLALRSMMTLVKAGQQLIGSFTPFSATLIWSVELCHPVVQKTQLCLSCSAVISTPQGLIPSGVVEDCCSTGGLVGPVLPCLAPTT